jgi:hypothetical protein
VAALISSLLALLAADASPPVPAGLTGTWDGPNGARVELTQQGTQVIGRLSAQTGTCALPAGAEVLKGEVLDDSLGAQVSLCLLAPACAEEQGQALAILLVTRQLTGGVHTLAPCASAVRSLVLRRPGPLVAQAVPAAGERLSPVPAPPPPPPAKAQARLPRSTRVASSGRLTGVPPIDGSEQPTGQLPGRPIGGEHGTGYDPRDARQPATARGRADRLLVRGREQLAAGDFERARRLFHEALLKEPGRPEAYNGVGVTFYGRLDLDEALAWYKRALESDPRFGDAYYNMACVYALQGKRELALRYLKLAAMNHYAERKQLEEDPDLASLRGDPELQAIVRQMSAGPPQRPSPAVRP